MAGQAEVDADAENVLISIGIVTRLIDPAPSLPSQPFVLETYYSGSSALISMYA